VRAQTAAPKLDADLDVYMASKGDAKKEGAAAATEAPAAAAAE
jgi:hypothetical protein